MGDLVGWLAKIGLSEYLAVFDENGVDSRSLADLTEDDLKELGVKLGHRRLIQRVVAEQDPADASPAQAVTVPQSIAPSGEADRRQLTIMFADLVGSTKLSTELEPEDLRDIIRQFQAAASAAIERFGGFIARYMGDGVLAYFGYPLAHEDDAERAVLAALELTERLASPDVSTGALMRVGIATGQVIVGDIIGDGASQESAVTGETPNLAARLQSVAEPGTLVIDEVTHSIVASAFETASLTSSLKGFASPVPYWEVISERKSETRFEARGAPLGTFVGRSNELGLLLERWETAATGDGQVALVYGEPGLGKSRLTEELHQRIGQGVAHLRLRYQCSPFHTVSPFYPIVQHLNRAAGIDASNTEQERLDKIEHIVFSGDDETRALFAELLSVPHESRYARLQLTAAVQKQRTVQALIGQLLKTAKDQPVLFVLEDAHWIDPSTHDLIRETITATANFPVMIVITHRPGWVSNIPEQPRVLTLPLSRLVTRQATDLAELVAGRSVPDDVIREIIERAEGIPLFVEELTKSMMERGLAPGQVNVPATLQASLTERFDRLGPAKDTAQAAAVIGREFELGILTDVLEHSSEDVTTALEVMLAAGLIHEGLGAGTYAWKHALVQDVAYGSLLRDQRCAFHLRAALALEEHRNQGTVVEPALMAHHYRGAGKPSEAAQHWVIAARSSLARAASEEIIVLARNALSDLENLDDETNANAARSEAHTLIGEAMIGRLGFASREVQESLETALGLAREARDLGAEFEALRAGGPVQLSTVGGVASLESASRMLEISEILTDDKKRPIALWMAGSSHFILGAFKNAENELESALTLVNDSEYGQVPTTGGADMRIPLCGYLAFTLSLRSNVDRAKLIVTEGLRIAEALLHPL
ncbi:MAG: class 3 adenylate cyclase, partial [Gammaproteobacteria bacterium]